jgi:hypothetical protein
MIVLFCLAVMAALAAFLATAKRDWRWRVLVTAITFFVVGVLPFIYLFVASDMAPAG